MKSQKYIKTAQVSNLFAPAAVAALRDKIHQKSMAGVLFFCSPNYNLDALKKSLKKSFDCPVIGCTTAGEIGTNYTDDTIVAISFSSKAFKMTPMLIENLDQFEQIEVNDLANSYNRDTSFKNSMGFFLIDGMSGKEEVVINAVYHAFHPLQIIGGSAGDGLKFAKTFVYNDGEFYSNAAVFTVIETNLDIETFKLQHFKPSDTDFIITDSDPDKRIIYEIDGEPAAEYYASLLNVPPEKLSPQLFAMHPMIMQIGSEWYLRSIINSNDNGSLTTACAIDTGVPLTLGKAQNISEQLKKEISAIKQKFEKINLAIGCDCLFRKLEITSNNVKEKIENELNRINFFGFNTYGEQYNSIHINQTLTGVIFGTRTF